MTTKNSERHDEAVRLREDGLSYAEIGRRWGISRERVRQIVKDRPTRDKPSLDSKVMLTVSDAAHLLSVHVNTVRRWSQKGILRAYRICSRGDRRFRREEIDSFLIGSEEVGVRHE